MPKEGGVQVRRGRKLFWCLGFVVILPLHSTLAQVINASDVDVARKKIAEARTALESLKGTASTLEAATRSMIAEVRSFPVEKIIVDADLAFQDGAFEDAATLYKEAVGYQSFRGQPGYFRALFRIGESLFQLGNLLSARTYFEQACEPAAGEFMTQSAARLFEICTRTKDFAPCERRLDLMDKLATPESLYAFGKYLYARGSKEKAMEFFGRVPSGSATFGRARYFMGVIAIGSNNLDGALQYFSEACTTNQKEESEVKALALLAMARVYFQKGQLEEALKKLKEIPPSASCFLESQIDMAWVYLKMNQENLAIQALDTVLMGTHSGPLALSAQALKGRILSRSKKDSDAIRAFKEIAESLDPVVNDLDRLVNDPAKMERFFAWVTQRDSRFFEVTAPIGPSALKWLEEDEAVGQVIRTLSDVAKERASLEEASEMADELLATLRSEDVLVSFPAIKENYMRSKELENKVLDVALSAAKAMEAVLLGRLEGEALAQYQEAVSARKKAQEGFSKVPSSYDAMKKREKDSNESLKGVETEVFKVETMLERLRKEVVAMEQWLADARARRAEELTEEKEKEFVGQLEEEKKFLQESLESLRALKKDIDKARIGIAGKSILLAEDDRVRADLWGALLEEASVLKEVGRKQGDTISSASEEAGSLIEECAKVAKQAQSSGSSLEALAREGAEEFERKAVAERERISEMFAELKKLEMDARLIANKEGREVVQRAAQRIHDVLLEADVGLVDAACAKAQELHQRQKELSARVGRLESRIQTAEALLKARGGEAAEQKKQEGVSQ